MIKMKQEYLQAIIKEILRRGIIIFAHDFYSETQEEI